jgi:hypothetical protein
MTFIFISVSVFGQTDSTIIGKYSFVEEKGIHGEPGVSIGNAHVTSYISHVDTTIKYSLLLDSNYNSTLEIDTTVTIFLGFRPKLKWYGKWEIINDTLLITFTELSMLWPFTVNGETTTPTIEKMKSQIIYEFAIKTYDNRIYGLELVNDERTITYIKE